MKRVNRKPGTSILHYQVDEQVFRRFKARAALKGLTNVEAIEQALELWESQDEDDESK